MVREAARQALLEKLKREVMEQEEKHGRGFDYALAHTCLNFLQDETTKPNETPESQFFFRRALPQISTFSRAKEERDVLVTRLLDWLIESITGRFRSDLTHKEIMWPQTIFHAPSAASEV